MTEEYGIVANINGTDRVAKKGSKAWLSGSIKHIPGDFHRAKWVCRSRSGRLVEKWIPTERLHNFRSAWVPDHIREQASSMYHVGTKEKMEELAKQLNELNIKKEKS